MKYKKTKRKLKGNDYFNFAALDNIRAAKASRQIESRHGATLKKELRNTFRRAIILDKANEKVYKRALREIDKTSIKNKTAFVNHLHAKYGSYLKENYGKYESRTKSTVGRSLLFTSTGKERKKYTSKQKVKKRRTFNANAKFNARKALFQAFDKNNYGDYFDDATGVGIVHIYFYNYLSDRSNYTSIDVFEEFFENWSIDPTMDEFRGKLNSRGLDVLKIWKSNDDISSENLRKSKYRDIRE